MIVIPHYDPLPPPPTTAAKTRSLSPRQRTLLHRLLHRELRKCSSTALATFAKHGWVHGWAGGYELTEAGRRVAERSERSPQGGSLVLEDGGCVLAVARVNGITR